MIPGWLACWLALVAGSSRTYSFEHFLSSFFFFFSIPLFSFLSPQVSLAWSLGEVLRRWHVVDWLPEHTAARAGTGRGPEVPTLPYLNYLPTLPTLPTYLAGDGFRHRWDCLVDSMHALSNVVASPALVPCSIEMKVGVMGVCVCGGMQHWGGRRRLTIAAQTNKKPTSNFGCDSTSVEPLSWWWNNYGQPCQM